MKFMRNKYINNEREVKSKVCVESCFRDTFSVNFGQQKLSLAHSFPSWFPIHSYSSLELVAYRIIACRWSCDYCWINWKNKDLGVNMKKTKVTYSGVNMDYWSTLVYGLVMFASELWEAIQFIALDASIRWTKSAVESMAN